MAIKYLVTGSRVYGPWNDGSDLDIVLLEPTARSLKEWLEANRFDPYFEGFQKEYDESKAGFYFQFFGFKINIIIVPNLRHFESWKYANERMLLTNSIKDKEERVRIFEKFRNQYLDEHPINDDTDDGIDVF